MNGLAETSEETIPAPMYVEMEQGENIARGCVEVTEVIAYDITKEPRRHAPAKAGVQGEIMTDKEGKTLYVEIPHAPCFCQDPALVQNFTDNHPDARIETFTIQLRKNTAIKKLNDPENMKQFKEVDNG